MDHLTAIIGDVHGCGTELEELTGYLNEALAVRRLVFTGDLLTKGPSPLLVLEILNNLKRQGIEIVVVCGNHDLRLHQAFQRMDSGESVSEFHKTERTTIERLIFSNGLDEARRWCAHIVNTVEWNTEKGLTVIHAGIRPEYGLTRSSDHDKIHLKARPGERHWWEDYDGSDGLIVVGHKPVFDPVRTYVNDIPVVVNIDTGCIHGGRLSAYLPGSDDIVSVESQQIKGRWNARRITSSVA